MDSSFNSLEDWVAVKRDIFVREGDINFADSSKIRFLVAYNSIEQKLAITCLQGSRKASDIKPKSMACCISLQAFRAVHNQLRIVHPILDVHFPTSLDSSEGFFPNLLASFSYYILRTTEEIDPETCSAIEQYLETAISIAGKGLLLALLFDDDNDPLSDFEEDIQEMRLKGFDNVVESSQRDLLDILKLRERVKSMKELVKIWKLEDESVSNLSVAISEKYNFQLQPFLQLREMAHNHIKQAKERLNDPDYGNRVKLQARKELREYNDQFLSANGALQHLYQEYYRKVVELISSQMCRMKEDEKHFGKVSFKLEGGSVRFLKLQVYHSKEVLKLLNTVKATKEYHREQLKKYLRSSESEIQSDKAAFEQELRRVELDIINYRLKILTEEGDLIKKRLELLASSDDVPEEDLFHDAVEDSLYSSCIGDDSSNKVEHNKAKMIESLKAERQSLARRCAHLRSRKTLLLNESKTETHFQGKEPVEEKIGNEGGSDPVQSSSITTRKSFSKEEEKKREEVHRKIRRQTLQRLNVFRKRSQNFCQDEKFFEDRPTKLDLKLPPYPWIDNLEPCEDASLPLPPELGTSDQIDQPIDSFPEMGNNIDHFGSQAIPSQLTAVKTHISCDQPSSLSSGCPPSFSLPTLTPPPPPPPPPPPAPFSTLSKQQRVKAFESCMEKSLRGRSISSDTSNNSTSSAINLNDILNARDRLKKCAPITKEIDEASQVAQNLMEALNKIRSVRCDSDEESDGEESNDFN